MHSGTSHQNGRYRQVPATYTPVVTAYIASQLAHVGRVRVSELLRRGAHKGNQITVMKNVMTSHIQVDDTLWMQGSVEMYGKVLDVHRFLLGNAHDLHAIRSLFGPIFLDGYVLRSLPNSHEGGVHERMSINWMAMQSPHTSLSDRDFLFLHYADVYVRDHDQLHPVTQTKPSDRDVLTACHVWESVELDGVPVLDHLDLARQRLSSWGFLIEALDHGQIRVTINVNQPKASASHRSWMEKLVGSLSRLEGMLYDHYDDGPCCNACTKTFSLLRRRVQCKQCKMSFCSKCAAQGTDLVVACRECASRHRIDNPSVNSIPLIQRTSSTSSRRHENLSQGPLKTSSSTSSSASARFP